MYQVSELIDSYLLWALNERGFDYSECLNSSTYVSLQWAIERVGEWIGGYTTPCCTARCFTTCQLEAIEQAIYILAFASDQLKTRPDSTNLEEWQQTAYRYLENRGAIDYAR